MISIKEMGKQNVIVPEELAVKSMMAIAADPAHRSALLPPRSAGLVVGCTSYKRFVTQHDVGGGARINAWVDSMRASSPTHAKAAAALSASLEASHDEKYHKWVVSFLASLIPQDRLPRQRDADSVKLCAETAPFGVEQLRRHRRSIQGEADRDVPRLRRDSVSHPKLTIYIYYIGIQMRETVRDAARHFPTAIVSGRCRDKVHSCFSYLAG
ncbi:hypothetical protein BHM03_00023371 [Ensete ventricosum]|nr:hypothetical protein BHM03_00023371 [Ensete ventricosum]